MTLEHASFISQIIAAIGIMASLIFVALEIRNNASAVRSGMAQAVHETYVSYYLALANNPGLAEISLKGMTGLADLQPRERMQSVCSTMALLTNCQNAFDHWRAGHLSQDRWYLWEQLLMAMMHTPGGAELWQQRSYMFSQAFQKEVATVIKKDPPAGALAFGVMPLRRTMGQGNSERAVAAP